MLFTRLFVFTLAVELIGIACYLFAPFCQSGRRPIIAKCVCAGLFILIGVFAMLAAGNFSIYAKLMISGLFFSFWGDLFLGISMKNKTFKAGILSFMTAHIFYISAFFIAIAARFPESRFFNPVEWTAIAAILIVMCVASIKLKLNMGSLKVFISVYTALIMTMLVKAISLSVQFYVAGFENSAAIALILISGAILFAFSDAVLSLSLFASKDSRSMTVLNLITYFSAQVLLASSIYFVVL